MCPPVAIATLLVTAPLWTTPAPLRQAQDTGATLRRVEEHRAAGNYQAAVDELRGHLERWDTSGRPAGGFGNDEFARMRELMNKLVSIRDLYQRAPQDRGAAAAYLKALVDPAVPSSTTTERARGIMLLARHDSRLREFIDAAFTAHLVMTVESAPDAALAGVESVPFRNALVEMSRSVDLPISLDGGDATLQVEMIVRENDRTHSILQGTGMHSYAVHMTALLEDSAHNRILEAATTTSVLGINPGNAAQWGMQRCAQRMFERIVDELAKRIERGEY